MEATTAAIEPFVSFRVDDPDQVLTRVRLNQELARPRLGPEFLRFAGSPSWLLLFPRPAADRMEYQFEFTYEDGDSELMCDPFNPLRAPGPFGDKSVVEFPEYEPPSWVDERPPSGRVTHHDVRSRSLHARVPVALWSSPGALEDEAVPLLVAHDGFDYAEYSYLLRFLSRMVEDATLPPLRAALLKPVDRDEIYSASASYARALTHEILPALTTLAPTPHGRRMRVGMGASLGGLAMLHAHRRSPALFGALYLQSSSFFRQRYDKQESHFVRFRRISRFVGQVLSAESWSHPIQITMTCGSVEENLANNRATRDALERQGYDIVLYENRDAHNWIAWRDTFDPYLRDLLLETWG